MQPDWKTYHRTLRLKIATALTALRRYQLWLSGLVLMLGLWGALSLRLPNDTGVLEEGKPSPVNIQARRSAEFISTARTSAARTQAESNPDNLAYTTDFELPTQQRDHLTTLLATISSVRTDPTLNHREALKKINELSSPTLVLSGTLAQTILDMDDDQWNSVRRWTTNTYERAVSETNYEIDEQTLHRLREQTLPAWTRHLPATERDLVLAFTTSYLRVNQVLDVGETQRRKKEARDAVEPVKVTVQAGENIVRRGDFVTREIIEKAQATGALPRKLGWLSVLGMGILSALLSLALLLFLAFLQKDIARQPRPLLVIIISIIITALAARLLQPLWPDQPYAFPLATMVLVLAVIFNFQIALAAATLLSVVVGVLDNTSLATTATMLLGSATAIFVVRGADRSLTFLLAGVAVAGITLLTQLGFCMLNSGSICIERVPTILLFSGTNGSLSAILSLGLFNLVGNAAGVVTPLKMMELAHPAQPLLRKLIHEAPGTYYHSVAVANLAEAAADVVGADALLLRVAAYYHDIGKTLRPYFFTDNQTGRENVHNDLDPHTSADIIIDHVREGIKMAHAQGLPQQIIDFISTHHGTHVVVHFYQLALREEDSVDIADFRYPGPKPWTREQGILMLADSVEATVRAKAQHGKLVSGGDNGNREQSVEHLVNQIIDERVRNGQLDNTPLTLRDLVLIRKAFVTSLQSIYHPRTEYARAVVKT